MKVATATATGNGAAPQNRPDHDTVAAGSTRLSVVVVTYNSADVIEACLRSVRAHLPTAEVIVVDNASQDRTPELCAAIAGVRLLTSPSNHGFGRACNLGADAATGTHLMFVNPDVGLVAADLDALQRESAQAPFGLVAPILAHRDRARMPLRPWPVEMLSHALGPLRPRELPTLPRPLIRRGSWWPAGALLLVARDEFARLGGFDRRFFLYYEDLDLARRYRAAGLPIRMTGAVRGRHGLHGAHGGGGSSGGDGAGAAIRQAWSYLSWLQYLVTWYGADTARAAALATRRLRSVVDRGLALAEHAPPLRDRVARKRQEFAELDRFVVWQSVGGNGTADADFCPEARSIVSAL